MGVGADGLGNSDDKVGVGTAGASNDWARARPVFGEDLERVPEAARGEAKETVLIMAERRTDVADAFIDSSDAKYNGAFAFAKCPFSRITAHLRGSGSARGTAVHFQSGW